MPKKRTSFSPLVFISHSHKDRHMATELQKTIEEHGAETYIDQERIEPGARLTKKIRDLITSSNTFLLIWSASAASSRWVGREWNLAHTLNKKIIPYCLDRTPLPPHLDDVVYIDSRDRSLGDAKLLKTIFGRPPKLPPVFPGLWRASVNIGGMMEATYDFELRENGQVEGAGGLSQSGFMPQGVGDLMKMRIPFHGSWSYDQGTKMLTIETSVTIMDRNDRETIRIHATGREKGAISGQDLGGRIWTLWRVGERVPSEVEDPKRQQFRKSVQNIYDVSGNSNIFGVLLSAFCSGYIDTFGEDFGLPSELLERTLRAEKGACEDLVNWLKREGLLK